MNILYIMGRGHNGSTVLDLILGNHAKIQSVGELNSGLRRGVDEVCACGNNLAKCEYWALIRTRFEEHYPEVGNAGYAKMLKYLDNFYRMPQILTYCLLPRWVDTQYLPMTRFLFQAIADSGKSNIVVDSSKEFSRGAFLLSRFPNEAKVIYLVRDGRAILWSYLKRWRKTGTFDFMRKKRKVKFVWPCMMLLIATFVVTEMLAQTLKVFYRGRILTVRYEDVCSSPSEELARIGDFVGINMEDVIARVEAGESLSIGHNIGGNAMRRSDTGCFTFKPDFAWKAELPHVYGWLYKWFGWIHAWPNGYN